MMVENGVQRFTAVRIDHTPTKCCDATHSSKEIALAGIRNFEKVLPLLVAFCADTDSLVRLQALFQGSRWGPQRLNANVAACLEAEQTLGRLTSEVSPQSGAALLLGACWQLVFLRQFLGINPFAASDG
jgi:hypothetical protein